MLALTALTSAHVARAQAARVDVRDSATGAPVPHAVITLRAADGRAAGEGVTSDAGRRTLRAPLGVYRVEVRRIGERPHLGPTVALSGTDTVAVTVRVGHAPVILTVVEVTGRATCRTLASPEIGPLWDAARTALALSVGAHTAHVNSTTVTRTFDARGVLLDETRSPTAEDTTTADAPAAHLFSSLPPDELERGGYVVGAIATGARFYGPDERALLSDGFARTHCFEPVRGQRDAARWIGVGFTPVRARTVADVRGVAWLDSASAELQRVDFTYTGGQLPAAARDLGGSVTFARLSDGSIGVVGWRIRIPQFVYRAGRLTANGSSETDGEVVERRGAPAGASPHAERRIAGLVYDSLLGAPLGGALVSAVGAPDIAYSDAAGHFVLEHVPTGRVLFTASHPALDSIGIDQMITGVDVTPGADAIPLQLTTPLTTPSLPTLRSRLCPTRPRSAATSPAATAIVVGVVRDLATDAPVPAATIVVRPFGTDDRDSVMMRADSAGAWAVCGVPHDAQLTVQAAVDGVERARSPLVIGARGLARIDLLVSAADTPQTGTIAGTVLDTAGSPITAARVVVDGVSGHDAQTDARGRFRIDGLLPGSTTLVVRAVGYAPQLVGTTVRPGPPVPLEARLGRTVTLAAVATRSRGERPDPRVDAIRARHALGTGYLVDTLLIRRTNSLWSGFRSVPFATVARPRGSADQHVEFTAPGGGRCVGRVFVDAHEARWSDVQDLAPDQVTAIEVFRRATELPVEFGGTAGRSNCGAILIWTR